MEKKFAWDDEKNEWLKKNRDLSFEEVVVEIGRNLLDVRENKSKKHQDQKVFILLIDNYTWVVPFEESENEIRLVTAFPDRRLLKEFLDENETV